MYAAPLPAAADPLLPAYVRAAGGVRLRFGQAGARTRRLELAESGGYRARFPDRADGFCEAVLINTGGGMTGGDAMRLDVAVDAGADVILTTQAAEKIYRSQGPSTAIDVRLRIAPGARLDWLPQETILFDGARLARTLDVDLAPDATLVASEAVVFGRSAMGETVGRGALRDRWRIRRGGRLVFAEDVRLEGAVSTLLGRPALGGGARALATIVAALPDAQALCEVVRERLGECAEVEGGAGVIDGLLVVRLLATEATTLRRAHVMLLGIVARRALPRTWSF